MSSLSCPSRQRRREGSKIGTCCQVRWRGTAYGGDAAPPPGGPRPDRSAAQDGSGGEAWAPPPADVRCRQDVEFRRDVDAVEKATITSPRLTSATAAHGTVPALLPSPDGTECGAADELVPTS